jgi:uncharacterized protein Yka (UPF0111/DUF47 family)
MRISEYLSKISDMEHEGDEFVHKLFSIIDQSFVTPLDREDISSTFAFSAKPSPQVTIACHVSL